MFLKSLNIRREANFSVRNQSKRSTERWLTNLCLLIFLFNVDFFGSASLRRTVTPLLATRVMDQAAALPQLF